MRIVCLPYLSSFGIVALSLTHTHTFALLSLTFHTSIITHSLEVIPGDAYRVERSGKDKAGGYVTKIVYNNNINNNTDGGVPVKEQEETTTTTTTKLDKKKERRKRQTERKKQLKRKMSEDDDNNDSIDDDRGGSSSTSAASKTKRIKSSIITKEEENVVKNDPTDTELTTGEDLKNNDNDEDDTIDEAINNLRTSWSIHAPGIVLHSTLCKGLVKLGYDRPTPIQSSSLPAAMLGRRDIVGAAPTGSGKTLGYGLPILQYLLEEADGEATENVEEDHKRSLQALILVPTRELAMQVTSELTSVSCTRVKIGTIVGGFAEVKQRRTLEKGRPPILVATPGRLWELVSSIMWTIFCTQDRD